MEDARRGLGDRWLMTSADVQTINKNIRLIVWSIRRADRDYSNRYKMKAFCYHAETCDARRPQQVGLVLFIYCETDRAVSCQVVPVHRAR